MVIPQGVSKVCRDWLTESDNRTHDVCKALAVLAFVVGLGLSIAAFATGKAFNLTEYGTGIGAMFVGIGAALKLKPETPATEEGK